MTCSSIEQGKVMISGLLTGLVSGVACWIGKSVTQIGVRHGGVFGIMAGAIAQVSQAVLFSDKYREVVSNMINILRNANSTEQDKEGAKQTLKSTYLKGRVISCVIGLISSYAILKVAAVAGLIIFPASGFIGAACATAAFFAVDIYARIMRINSMTGFEKIAQN